MYLDGEGVEEVAHGRVVERQVTVLANATRAHINGRRVQQCCVPRALRLERVAFKDPRNTQKTRIPKEAVDRKGLGKSD